MRRLQGRHRGEAMEYLRAGLPEDLLLFDLLQPQPAEAAPRIESRAFAAWRGDAVAGLVLTHPTVILDSRVDGDVLDALCGPLESIESGLIKTSITQAESAWKRMRARGRRAHLDRTETGFWLRSRGGPEPELPPGSSVRAARLDDLGVLVGAAKASLREEGRPDPSIADPRGFREWVAGRMPRARVIEHRGEVAFVGYADVRRPEGWLIQGVYTMPDLRRRGFAAAGMKALIDQAFAAGADHVQLTAIDGNRAALRLYEALGFEIYGQMRTILFS